MNKSNHAVSRRKFLYIATGAFGGATLVSALAPLVTYMNPDATVRSMASIEVDVSGIAEGQQLTVMWRGKPVFIRHRTQAEIVRARKDDSAVLIDGLARNNTLSQDAKADDVNRTLDKDGKWLVLIGICTHLGCVPVGGSSGEYEGWFCPCHGSHYDISGRIRKGPAPSNLEVPIASFVSDNIIKVG